MSINAFLQGQAGGSSQRIMALLGVGSQVGVILPFSRFQKKETDILGLRYLAQAGFDPRESVDLWRNDESVEHIGLGLHYYR